MEFEFVFPGNPFGAMPEVETHCVDCWYRRICFKYRDIMYKNPMDIGLQLVCGCGVHSSECR